MRGLRFMGDAAVHEVEKHNIQTLDDAFDVSEHLLQDLYLLPQKASRFKKPSKGKLRS
jgi:hypothetical protein